MAKSLESLATQFTTGDGRSFVSDKESQLIELCRRGDRDSQKQLYQQHCERIYQLMFRMVGSTNADDLTQQVFLCVFQKLDKFQGRSSFSTWLYRLASNEALQFLRRRRRDSDQPMLVDVSDDRRNASDDFEQHELMEWALSRLDPELRAVLLLREVDGLSYYDIALALDIAEGTVASRLNRARRCLLELIE